MLHNVRSKWLAGGGAVLLALSMSGLAAGATLVDDTTPSTLATFEDLNGNGIDDDCETAVTAAPDAVTAAMAAVDANADGVISTTEAAHSEWVGGVNCNHGGFVSMIANSSGDECDEAETPEAPEATTDESNGQDEDSDEGSPEDSNHAELEADAPAADCPADAPEADEADSAKDAAREACLAAQAAGTPTSDPVALAAMSHVDVAQSDMAGGKNCNHGGIVSEHNKLLKAERDAAKQAAREARDAAKALKHANKHAKHGGQN
jgi:hypothetical protein